MILRKRILVLLSSILLACCAPESDSQQYNDGLHTVTPDELSVMRVEFMESCQARPEYIRKKRAGTLDKHCNCIFKTTMHGLPEDEQRTAAIYLYGETHEAFLERFRADPPPTDAMPAAVKAVAKAAKVCR